MPPIWIIEESTDGGKTWRISQPYHVYKRKASADKAVAGYDGWRWKYRITEYRAVEDQVVVTGPGKEYAEAVGISKENQKKFLELYKMGFSQEKAKSMVEGK